jgi:putative sigma-54 modulation protein
MTQKTKFDAEGYNVSIKGKNLQLTDAIKNYVLEKVSKIDRFANHIIDVAVTLDVQKLTHSVSIVMKFLHFKIQVHSATEDLYSSVDKATEKLLRLISKYKNKLQHHRIDKALTESDMTVSILQETDETDEVNDLIEEETLREEEEKYKIHKVVAKKTLPLKEMVQDEAVMKMELSGDTFLLYKCEENQKIRLIYRRKDGEYGVIEVE